MLNPVPSLYGVRKFYKYIMINMQISCLVQSPNVLCAYIQEKYQTTVAFPKQVTSHTWLYMDNRWVCIISKLEGKLTVKCTCIMNLQCAERQEFNVLLLIQALECEPSSRPPRDRTERGLALRGPDSCQGRAGARRRVLALVPAVLLLPSLPLSLSLLPPPLWQQLLNFRNHLESLLKVLVFSKAL